jgi:glycosyltransferase involved in cell wall biosynthesis
MTVAISVVIPACDSRHNLARCLEALRQSDPAPVETVVVDDGSKDDTADVALGFGAKLLSTGHRRGPAYARNLGAKIATGDVLLFLDSDVCVKPDTLAKIARSFDADPELDALMGSYDSTPGSQDFLSQYRNLMHSYFHQTGAERACTFWSGCGAIRRNIFLEHSGFSEDYGRPAIEDIELGYRLMRAKRKIVLDRTVLVTHLKRWTFWGLVRTDILDRGIPWTELILRDRRMPNDLNLQLSQRVSVALVFILVALSGVMAIATGGYLLIPLFAILFLLLGRWWSEPGIFEQPRRAYLLLNLMVALIALFAYSHRMFGLIPPLLLSPVLLHLQHRYSRRGKANKTARWLGIMYVCGSVGVAVYYLPAHHHLGAACFAVLALIGLMNSQFYIFLAGKRGVGFMLAAIPFHLLYHFYNGLSFLIGSARHYWTAAARVPLLPSTAADSNLKEPRKHP